MRTRVVLLRYSKKDRLLWRSAVLRKNKVGPYEPLFSMSTDTTRYLFGAGNADRWYKSPPRDLGSVWLRVVQRFFRASRKGVSKRKAAGVAAGAAAVGLAGTSTALVNFANHKALEGVSSGWQPWEKFLDLHGNKVPCLETGQENDPKLLILYHQGNNTYLGSNMTQNFVETLQDTFPGALICSYDYPGFGDHVPTKRYRKSFAGVNRLAKDVFLSLRERYPDVPFFQIGYSFGGCPASYLAKRFEGFIEQTLLLDPITSVRNVVSHKLKSTAIKYFMLTDSCDTLKRLGSLQDRSKVHAFLGDMSGHVQFPKGVTVDGGSELPHMELLAMQAVHDWLQSYIKLEN